MELCKVTDTAKIVTDPVLLAILAGQGIDKDGVALAHDYAPRSKGKGYSPYGKLYRDMNSAKQFMVVSVLPMVDACGQGHELEWRDKNGIIASGNNIFHAIIAGLDTRLVALSGQPGGVKKDGEVIFHPQLFIGGSEVKPAASLPKLLETDPANGNYHNNVLEWDYGVCQRRIRLIEGRFLGSWVFTVNPRGNVRIKYNQSGHYRLKLGHFRVNDDEEIIPAAYFANPESGYPVIISDTATFYPDANPESATVDGLVYFTNSSGDTWSNLLNDTGDGFDDVVDQQEVVYIRSDETSPNWEHYNRSIFLFDTSSLADNAIITDAVFSLYGYNKNDGLGIAPDINIYASNPASNTVLAAADYAKAKWGTTALSTAKVIADWNTSGYNNFTLNSAGLSVISNTGLTKLGVRNANYDVAETAPTHPGSRLSSYYGADFSEKGTGYKPKLVITYNIPEEKTSVDSGSGMEVINLRSQEVIDQGSGTEASLVEASIVAGDAGSGNEIGGVLKSLAGSDGGSGSDALKTLVRKAGSDLRLRGHRSEVDIPHKEVGL